jgi:peptidoglycan glycosyltransferase
MNLWQNWLDWVKSKFTKTTNTPRRTTTPRTSLRQNVTVFATQLRALTTLSGWESLFITKEPVLSIENPAPNDPNEAQSRECIFPPNKSIVTIGNSRGRDILIRNDCVSREHLEIIQKRNNRYLQDKGSTNKTYKRRFFFFWQICAKDKEYLLNHRDVFSLGNPRDRKSVRIKYVAPYPLHIKTVLWCRNIAIATGILLSSSIVLFCLYLLLFWSQIPGNTLPVFKGTPIIIYASDRQTYLKRPPTQQPQPATKISQFPEFVAKAVVASEDSRYYQHFGVDLIGILRAIVSNMIPGGDSEGGSTITQQVARTLYPAWVGRDRNAILPVELINKAKEAAVAIKLNATHDKDTILLAYLNSVFLGRENNGFKAATKDYFNKDIEKLNPAEATTLVAMLPAPNGFDLCRSNGDKGINRLTQRRERVIDRMKTLGYLQSAEAREAKLTPISTLFESNLCAKNRQEETIIARIYDSLIYRELERLMPIALKEGNLIIESTIDVRKQKRARAVLENTFKEEGEEKNIAQGALVSINSKTGAIVALVSAVEPQEELYIDKKGPYFYDYATIETLSPGSTFKVFAYTAALNAGMSAEQIYDCQPLDFDGEKFQYQQWVDSYCKSPNDRVNLARGIAKSDNLIALKVAKDAGLERIIDVAKKMGIQSKLTPAIPRLVLGQRSVTLLEMTGAYGVLANRGLSNNPHIISRVIDISDPQCDRDNYNRDADCLVVYTYEGDEEKGLKPDSKKDRQVFDAEIAEQMTKLLKGVVASGGTASAIDIQNAVGKTGTSDGSKDLWFIGYIPEDLVTGVWLGNPAYKRKSTNATSKDAALVWQAYMQKLGY